MQSHPMEHQQPKIPISKRYPILCSQCHSIMKASRHVTRMPLTSMERPAHPAIYLITLTSRPLIAKAALLSNHSMYRIGSASILDKNSFLTQPIQTSISTETIKHKQTPSTPSVFPIPPSKSAHRIPLFTKPPRTNA